jgi:hypothetical protein
MPPLVPLLATRWVAKWLSMRAPVLLAALCACMAVLGALWTAGVFSLLLVLVFSRVGAWRLLLRWLRRALARSLLPLATRRLALASVLLLHLVQRQLASAALLLPVGTCLSLVGAGRLVELSSLLLVIAATPPRLGARFSFPARPFRCSAEARMLGMPVVVLSSLRTVPRPRVVR